MIPLTKQERIKEIEKRLSRIQRSTKTLFPRFDVVHNYLRQRSGLYERWHIWPYSRFIHWTFFSLYTVGLIVFSLSYFGFFSYDQRTLASSNIPKMLNYSGRLADKNNLPVADGNYNVRISIYDSASGGNCLWTFKGNCSSTEAVSISVSNGMFSIMLGDTASYAGTNSLNLDFNSDSYYLGVTVGSDSEMKPRRRVGAVAFAYNSDTTDGYHFDQSLLTAASPSFAGLSVDTNTLHIDSSNDRVGIGTTSPVSKLHIGGGGITLEDMTVKINFGTGTDVGGGDMARISYEEGVNGFDLFTFSNHANKGTTDRVASSIQLKSTDDDTGSGSIHFLTSANSGAAEAAERVTITGSGNVGISTTSPGAPLEISSTSDGILRLRQNESGNPWNYLEFYNSSERQWALGSYGGGFFVSSGTGDNRILNVLNTGNVGIGTTAPTSKLTFGAASTIGVATLDGTDNSYLQLSGAGVAGATRGAYLQLFGNEHANLGALHLVSGLGDGSATASQIKFFTGSGPTQRMVIDRTGLVGIGTTAPGYKLDILPGNLFAIVAGADIAGSTRTDDTRKLVRIGMPHYDTDQVPITLVYGDSDGTNNNVAIGGGTSIGRAATAINFYTAATTTTATGTVRMNINSSGQIGIGTTAQTQDLSFGGNSARTVWLERHTTANTAGNNLTVQSGGATSGATDKAGGTLILSGGISTGGGESSILFKTAGTTTTGGVATATLNGGGTGYVIGDQLTLNAGDTNATLLVKTVDGSGVIQTFSLGTLGAEVITTNAGLETYGGTPGLQDDGVTDTFTGWGVSAGTASKVEATATVHSGSNAMKITRAAGTSPYAYRNTGASTITPGAVYEFSFWTRGDGTYQGDYSVYDVTNSAYIDGLVGIATGVTGTTYTQVKVYFTAPAGCTQVRVYLRNTAAVGAAVYYDDASLKIVTANAGSGYSVATGVGVTGGTGSSATFNITGLTGTSDNTPATKMAILGNGKVGIDTTAPDRHLEINVGAATGGLRLTYNDPDGSATVYSDFLVDSNGSLTVAPSSAIMSVTGSVQPTTDDTYYLGKNDDDTPAAWKGVTLKDTTNGKYYRLEIINGVVTATDLTD